MAENTQQAGAVFSIEKIYIKDVSYEAPNAPRIFIGTQTQPHLDVHLDIKHSMFDDANGVYEVVLAVTATAKQQETTLFLVEAHQAGLFRIVGVPPGDLLKILEIACPNILLPFVREVINEMVVKGGFPQLLINPVNFEALYEQKHAAKQQQVGNL